AGGPLGGSLRNYFGLASPLFFYAGLLLVAGVLFLRFVPDPEPAPSLPERDGEERQGSSMGALLRRREFLAAIGLNFAYLWIIAGAIDTLIPLFGHNRLGMSTQGIGFVVAIALVGELIVLYPAGSAM